MKTAAVAGIKMIEMPKEDFTTRPIALLEPEIRLYYQFLVDQVCNQLEPEIQSLLENVVFSHRPESRKAVRWFGDPRAAFWEFRDAQLNAIKAGRFRFLLKLDIASYYERVYQHPLENQLAAYGVEADVKEPLIALLKCFSRGDSHGIPQGLWPSDYLANVYLLPLDHRLKSEGLTMFRYVDDYAIFTETKADAKRTLVTCIEELRKLGLNVNSMKTEILETDKALPDLRPITERFLELRKHTEEIVVRYVDPIVFAYFGHEAVISEELEEEIAELEGAIDDDTIAEFEKLWNEAVDQESKSRTILNFALSGLAVKRDATAEEFVLSQLGELPHLAPAVSRYLQRLGYKREITQRLLEFLEGRENIYPWQEAWLIQYFRLKDIPTSELREYLFARIGNRNVHEVIRVNAIEIFQEKANNEDVRWLKDVYQQEDNLRVKRTLLLALKRLPRTERNHFLSYAQQEGWSLSLAAQIAKSV